LACHSRSCLYWPTVAQTVGIATAAAVAGLLVGKLIS
jgi:hypothetical protein